MHLYTLDWVTEEHTALARKITRAYFEEDPQTLAVFRQGRMYMPGTERPLVIEFEPGTTPEEIKQFDQEILARASEFLIHETHTIPYETGSMNPSIICAVEKGPHPVGMKYIEKMLLSLGLGFADLLDKLTPDPLAQGFELGGFRYH